MVDAVVARGDSWMSPKKHRKYSKLEVFFRNLWLVAQERLATACSCLSIEWDYWVTRAWVWHGYKELDAAGYDEETGQFRSSIEPQEITYGERYLDVIKTMKLRRLADRFHIQMPDESDPENYGSIDWDYDHNEPKYLTGHGLQKLLPLIRAAQKERRDAAGFWFGVTVGLIGALTGLVSAIS